jgi:hypothetical protein
MNKAARFLVALLLPALAIVVGAGAQEVLSLWVPAMNGSTFGSMTLGSYVGVLLECAVCAIAAYWLFHRERSTLELGISEIAPAAWAVALFVGVLPQVGAINWRSQLAWVFTLGAVAPALGVVLGWFLSSQAHGKGA